MVLQECRLDFLCFLFSFLIPVWTDLRVSLSLAICRILPILICVCGCCVFSSFVCNFFLFRASTATTLLILILKSTKHSMVMRGRMLESKRFELSFLGRFFVGTAKRTWPKEFATMPRRLSAAITSAQRFLNFP